MYSKTDQLIGFDLTYGTNASIPYAFFYSSNKLVEKVSSGSKDTLFKYDEGSKLKIQTNANGVQDRFDYNEGNQLTGTSSVNSSGLKMWSSNYAYDPDGRLVMTFLNGEPVGWDPEAQKFWRIKVGCLHSISALNLMQIN